MSDNEIDVLQNTASTSKKKQRRGWNKEKIKFRDSESHFEAKTFWVRLEERSSLLCDYKEPATTTKHPEIRKWNYDLMTHLRRQFPLKKTQKVVPSPTRDNLIRPKDGFCVCEITKLNLFIL